MDGNILNTTDTELADKKLAGKLHRHNPPQVRENPVNPGDLIMINSSRTKLKPRETFLVNDVKKSNGSEWAETFKQADKITSKPQLVKTEDLTVLPRQKRHAAARAEEAIKNLVYCVNALKDVPTHAWNYSDFGYWDLEDQDHDDTHYYDEHPIPGDKASVGAQSPTQGDNSFLTKADSLSDKCPVAIRASELEKEGIPQLYPTDPSRGTL